MGIFNINRSMVKVGRWSGYILIFFIFVFFLTGFGQTRGILPRIYSKYLHEKVLPLPAFFFFILHTLLNIKFALIRNGFRNQRLLNIYLLCVGVMASFGFVYIYFK